MLGSVFSVDVDGEEEQDALVRGNSNLSKKIPNADLCLALPHDPLR